MQHVQPGSGAVSGRATCGSVACGAPDCPSGALVSDTAEVGDELPGYASEGICIAPVAYMWAWMSFRAW